MCDAAAVAAAVAVRLKRRAIRRLLVVGCYLVPAASTCYYLVPISITKHLEVLLRTY